MKKALRVILGVMVVLLVAGVGGYWYFLYAPAPTPPQLTAPIQSGSVLVGTMRRTYVYYVPVNLPANAPLLLVFHGALQDGQKMRVATGYEFEQLADRHKFVVVYPDGYQGGWNTCQKMASDAAKTQNIDDEGFVRALIAQFHSSHSIDLTRVFAAGYSNGGQMAYRLAVDMSDVIDGVAAIAANFPAPDNLSCQGVGQPVPVLVMNGTDDPLNPYLGGNVTLFGFGARGDVLPTQGTIAYFSGLAAQTDAPVVRTLPHVSRSGSTSVTVEDYAMPGRPEVALYTINGGGHVVPQPVYRAPRILGATTQDVDGPAVIWDFFARQAPLQTRKSVEPSP